MTRYASNTSVSVSKSKAEIENILQRYGASQFISGWTQKNAFIGFVINKRHIKLMVVLPPREDFAMTPAGKRKRAEQDILKAWEQACRQRWRALALVIKAKLEAVECGIATFENEFLAYTCLPGGKGETIGQILQPQIEEAITTGQMPKLLTGIS